MSKYRPCADHLVLMQSAEYFKANREEVERIYNEYGQMIVTGLLPAVLSDARIFDFTSIVDDDGTYDFAGELLVHGLLEPPFDVTLFFWDDPLLSDLSGTTSRRAFALSICVKRRGAESDFCKSHDPTGILPKLLMSDANDTLMLLIGGCVDEFAGKRIGVVQDVQTVKSYDSGLQWDGTFKRYDKWPFGSGVQVMNEVDIWQSEKDTSTTLRRFLSYCGLLNTRGVTATVYEPRTNVVERRARERKLPWLSYSVINPLMRSSRAGDGASGAVRQSPRAHYRRGHVRRLASGLITTVAPCLVGSEANGKVISSYVAKANDPGRVAS